MLNKKLLGLSGNHNLLVIVDMQEGFKTANHPATINKCLELITLFKREKLPILTLQYEDTSWAAYGTIIKPIQRKLHKYTPAKTLLKSFDSGYHEINHYVINELGWAPEEVTIVICGVNADACVRDTANDLIHYEDYKVIVVKRACNASYRSYDWSDYKKHINLKTI